MMWTDSEFDDIINFFGDDVPNILIALAEGYHINPDDSNTTIRKIDKIADDFTDKQVTDNSYRSFIEGIIKNEIKSITKIGDGFNNIGVLVRFKDGDKQKVLTDAVDSDIDTSILLCILKHYFKNDGDKNGSHALNRIMLAIKKKRDEIMVSTVDQTAKRKLKKEVENEHR